MKLMSCTFADRFNIPATSSDWFPPSPPTPWIRGDLGPDTGRGVDSDRMARPALPMAVLLLLAAASVSLTSWGVAASDSPGHPPCAAGNYSNAANTSCLPCPAGSRAAAGAARCVACAVGKYAPRLSGECAECVPGRYDSDHLLSQLARGNFDICTRSSREASTSRNEAAPKALSFSASSTAFAIIA